MISIGLIGGIASGKSEVSRMLAERGAAVVDADRVAHEAYAPGTEGFATVVRAFGTEVVGDDGAIDRRKLGAMVFGRPEKMQQLTSIVWPRTRSLLEERKAALQSAGTRVFVLEAAVLVEAGWSDLVDEVWFVRTPLDQVRQRLKDKRGLTAEEAEARINSRNLEPLLAAATRVIDNDGDLAQLEAKVEAAWSAALANQD